MSICLLWDVYILMVTIRCFKKIASVYIRFLLNRKYFLGKANKIIIYLKDMFNMQYIQNKTNKVSTNSNN